MSNNTATKLDWTALGKALRASVDDAHDSNTPSVTIAYDFLLEYPESFIDMEDYGKDGPQWPEDMPEFPPAELIAAYYGSSNS